MSKQTTIALIMILTPVVCVLAGVESRIASSIALFLYVGGCYFFGRPLHASLGRYTNFNWNGVSKIFSSQVAIFVSLPANKLLN